MQELYQQSKLEDALQYVPQIWPRGDARTLHKCIREAPLVQIQHQHGHLPLSILSSDRDWTSLHAHFLPGLPSGAIQ